MLALVPLVAAGLAIAAPAGSQPGRCLGRPPTIVGSEASETITGTEGDDVISGLGGDDTIDALGGNDRVCGDAGNDSIEGGDGNDGINGGLGKDTASFSTADTAVTVDLSTTTASGQGSDRLAGVERVAGSPFDDHLTGNDDSNRLSGGNGNDALVGNGGIDLLNGGGENDGLDGGDGNDVAVYSEAAGPVDVNLGNGAATGEGSDTLAAVEAIFGSPHDDVLQGDGGDNFLFGSGGNDNLTGGGGYDFAVYWFAGAPITADLTAGTASGEGTDTLKAISGLLGSPFDDSLTGDAVDNYIDGDEGNDILSGGDGDDLFIGRAGDDTFHGGPGAFDRIDFRGTSALDLDFGAGTASGEGTDTLDGIEGAGATKKRDVLRGDGETDYFKGRGGGDTISGGDGDDFLDGGPGQDRGDGGPGKDACKSFEVSKKGCEKKDESPEHPLEKTVDTAESYRRNF